ncbi:hypothetical protein B0H16DRAFT_1508551 [Mycena metata]|uniref:Uncharacterized protein n=1 Tax=Mycena metata TaxID=1033252 RepID=A0AAD7JZ09_9AGAR|nr:hypothetical protein B0H16DRAFT_1508551 [Mycena metata]
MLQRARQSFSPNRVRVVLGISAASLAAIGVTGLLVDRGTHMWLEYTLDRDKKEIDSDTREWGWELEAERWTGDPNQGGTDSHLPSAGRKAVRNAWFSHHRPEKYGRVEVEEDAQVTNTVDAVLLRTELCLRGALTIAEQPDVVGKLHPCTLPDLITRRASILERLGPAHLPESRAQYDRVFRLLGGKGLQAARIAVKIGDLNQRLGEGADALAWWARAVQLVGDDETITSVPITPPIPPSSPAAQRILASALVSTSAFYATTRQLKQAQTLEEDGLDLLRSIRPPESLASASPPQALHALSLLHRSAVLSLHLSEVLHAQRAPVTECVKRLHDAATSSERVACALSGTSVPDSEILAPSAVDPLGDEYLSNPYLLKPASDLLRDARRSAADAWNLMGELTETMGPAHRPLALVYYTRALAWAGRINKAGKMEPTESTLRDDWRLLWKNYTRVKRVLDVSESK